MGHSILVVDDDKEFLQTLAKSLSENGYEVFTAESGQDASRFLEERTNQFGGTANLNAIISDWQMPNGTGLELLSYVRKSPHRAITFLLMSGAVSREELASAVALGPDGVVLKPFEIAVLCKKIEQAIQKREEIELNKMLKGLKI